MRFGQYELFGKIAVGGMAEIYRGRAVGEEGFEKPVAIKRILPHFAQDSRFVTMLLTEARIHASLSHRNIVQIHDLGISEEGEYFIVLEYVDGRDLAALLEVVAKSARDGGPVRLTDAVALYIAIELAEGVHFAHELRGADGQPLGLIHRDISPSNVLISYAGEVKLSDFGLAKRRTDHSVVGSLKGKLAYMSPEQARRSALDKRSDIFALGAVLFEMLTGRRLREITDDVQGWQQVASGLVPPPQRFRADLTPSLERLLTGALAPDPRDRFQDAGAFVRAAREALEQVPRASESESAELQALIRKLLPPGSPRPVTAPSKVIRLVSEFVDIERTVRAAAPLPGITPSRGRATPAIPPRRTPSPRPTPVAGEGGGGPRSAAPPPIPASAGFPRRPTPGMTPPRPRPPTGEQPAMADAGHGWPATTRSAPSATNAPFAEFARPAPLAVPPAPSPLSSQMVRGFPPPAAAAARRGAAPAPLGLRLMLAVAVAVGALAWTVHHFVVPLPLVGVWGTPARMDVRSEPAGAEVFLDGVRLEALTPMYAEVPRDRREHVVELRKDGYEPVRRPVRYDREERVDVTVTLRPAGRRPSYQPMPTHGRAAPPK